jgi:hypothetical protein
MLLVRVLLTFFSLAQEAVAEATSMVVEVEAVASLKLLIRSWVLVLTLSLLV